MTSTAPLIALISATPAAIDPARRAIVTSIPDARVWNLLDDRLLTESETEGGVTPRLRARMNRLIEHALLEHADAVLLTCSQYASAATTAREGAHVLAADEAAFAAVLASEPKDVLVVASLVSAADDSAARLQLMVQTTNLTTRIHTVVPPQAFHAVRDADAQTLAQILATAVVQQSTKPAVVLLAQYSLAPAAEELARLSGVPVVSGPGSAASAIASLLGTARS